jgi:acetoin utilization deacetylase AcuC-like enzyme
MCGSAARFGEEPGFSDACFSRDAIGFRCVRKAPAEIVDGEPSVGPDDEPPAPADAAGRRGAAVGAPAVFALASSPSRQAAAEPETPRENRPAAGTGFVYGDIYLQHDTGRSHPERPERLTAIIKRLEKHELLSRLACIKPRPAAEQWLSAVHTPAHVAGIRSLAKQGGGHAGSADTPVSPESYKVAVEAVGGVLAAVDAVMDGKARNAFCAVRPPGHHATRNRAMGFCLFNNVAIAARYIQQKYKLSRILIVDWDVHHGNGTQAIFYDDPSVFYFSVHQYPFYPGTGGAKEKGEGKGLGTTLNVPLDAGCGDGDFQKALEEKLVPAMKEFKPEFVLISAGFDAHRHDPLGGMKVTEAGFAELTRIVENIAQEHCGGRLVSVLEGGYGLEGLAASVEAHLRVLMD